MQEDHQILKRFGDLVRSHRNQKGYSQEYLAEKAGVHRTYIGMIERGEKNITLLNIQKICLALEINIEDFFSQLNK